MALKQETVDELDSLQARFIELHGYVTERLTEQIAELRARVAHLEEREGE